MLGQNQLDQLQNADSVPAAESWSQTWRRKTALEW